MTGGAGRSERLGFVGLGAMGGAIARNLIRAQTRMKVFDLRPDVVQAFADLGAEAADSLAQMADRTIVVLCLPGPQEFEETLFGDGGLGQVLGPGALVVDMTSNDPKRVKHAALRLARKGIDLVDAPVA